MKKLLIVIAVFILVGCGGSSTTNYQTTVTPPICAPVSGICAEESIIGEYELRSFGLEQISTGYIVRDETDFEPWSGTMIIDEWEMVRRISKTPDRYSDFTQGGYRFFSDGDFSGFGRNGTYVFDGTFIILMPYLGSYSIGSTNWGMCFEYEYWEKVSDNGRLP